MANLKPKVLRSSGIDGLLDDNDNLRLAKAPLDNFDGANKKYVDDTTTALGNLLDNKIADAETNLNNEIVNRTNADTALDGRIDQEITDRGNADQVLQNQIDSISGGSLDTLYVQRSGDDMTGNLTINTDKIVLETTGAATFFGALEAASIDGGTY